MTETTPNQNELFFSEPGTADKGIVEQKKITSENVDAVNSDIEKKSKDYGNSKGFIKKIGYVTE